MSSESCTLGYILKQVKLRALTRVTYMAEVLRLGLIRLRGVEHGDN